MKVAHALFWLSSCLFLSTNGHPLSSVSNKHSILARKFSVKGNSLESEEKEARGNVTAVTGKVKANHCFPALGFQPPSGDNAPLKSLSNWWCPSTSEENGFLGFTYGSSACQSYDTLVADFTRMRGEFKSRYVRLYSWCDGRDGYYDDVVKAAYRAGLGVYATIWFGFDGGDAWKGRRDLWIDIINNNRLAPYVVRTIDVGSEPLFDWVLDPYALAEQINYLKSKVGHKGVKVSISEMQYGYSVQGDSQVVLDAQDVIHAHQLPFFDADASYGSNALPSVSTSTAWFVEKTYNAKKIIFTQTGWPTNTNIWPPNSPNAIASVDSAQAYAQLLDDNCENFKTMTSQRGIGWFWHIWKDEMLDGWGLLDGNNNPKWNFAPRTQC